MPEKSDITVTLPIEHFTALSAVISSGLNHAQITPRERIELRAWWQAESELIQDEIDSE
jgi:hypothetical protein